VWLTVQAAGARDETTFMAAIASDSSLQLCTPIALERHVKRALHTSQYRTHSIWSAQGFSHTQP
jgi:hypothetical protein